MLSKKNLWKTALHGYSYLYKKLGVEFVDKALWQAVLGELEVSLSRGNFVTWFKNTRMLRFKDGIFVVGVPNVFIKQQLERKYIEQILQTLAKNNVKPERLEFKIHSEITVHKKTEDDPVILSTGESSPISGH